MTAVAASKTEALCSRSPSSARQVSPIGALTLFLASALDRQTKYDLVVLARMPPATRVLETLTVRVLENVVAGDAASLLTATILEERTVQLGAGGTGLPVRGGPSSVLAVVFYACMFETIRRNVRNCKIPRAAIKTASL